MPASSKYRNCRRVNMYIENDMLNDFKDICWDERKTLTDKITELIIETVEKKALGGRNPIDVHYSKQQEKPSLSMQSDIRMWLPRHEAIVMARRLNLRADEYEHLSQTFGIIARKVKTGYLHKD